MIGNRQRGFTLIEVLAVLSIITLLVSLSAPVVQMKLDNAKLKQAILVGLKNAQSINQTRQRPLTTSRNSDDTVRLTYISASPSELSLAQFSSSIKDIPVVKVSAYDTDYRVLIGKHSTTVIFNAPLANIAPQITELAHLKAVAKADGSTDIYIRQNVDLGAVMAHLKWRKKRLYKENVL